MGWGWVGRVGRVGGGKGWVVGCRDCGGRRQWAVRRDSG